MSEDALKSLLADEAATVPAQDYEFLVAVMDRVARRRLIDDLITLTLAVVAISAVLWLTAPYLTPALVEMGQPLLPAAGIVTAVLLMIFAWDQLRPVLRDYGVRL
ncbi:MAG: hypothetical protein ACXU8O_02570 [Asticcacaulis sp.]